MANTNTPNKNTINTNYSLQTGGEVTAATLAGVFRRNTRSGSIDVATTSSSSKLLILASETVSLSSGTLLGSTIFENSTNLAQAVSPSARHPVLFPKTIVQTSVFSSTMHYLHTPPSTNGYTYSYQFVCGSANTTSFGGGSLRTAPQYFIIIEV